MVLPYWTAYCQLCCWSWKEQSLKKQKKTTVCTKKDDLVAITTKMFPFQTGSIRTIVRNMFHFDEEKMYYILYNNWIIFIVLQL